MDLKSQVEWIMHLEQEGEKKTQHLRLWGAVDIDVMCKTEEEEEEGYFLFEKKSLMS